ncbi:DUF202 domain-containing protein [Corynebacterium sp. 153RC1]|uniref:YidH family protein n=1 Tax=Corynebacterium TaxID=1716 RepID=UPI00211BEF20|nr:MULTISPECIES: DUF202 domain-containing protein [unclassified Corynebacterium]MCQ9342925.1 DUF202 domain-containing protein [Corynebacterium sp. 76QC2CO]MCQ9353367.1 DUF202 domain-containing protein [Corynebacterium sp. 209RC1]MCQ9355616.1 DUF202 domain-containing protein [Corynebacterium sp. 1222RC1]MCQ9357318.1 DUF202 domain-containing protein [Corynebacterium sp. 122RC1]MCQ9359494.1 DUF202 domain-containing protein [Corynebacterium sp. 142RC1]
MDDQRGALSKLLFPKGSDPDPRFTLANERTFLAWIRTALALLAGGIAADAFAAPLAQEGVRQWEILALVLPIFGFLVAASALIRWVRVERAMREGRSLPVPGGAVLVGTAVLVAAVILWSVGAGAA